jgi:hypothetical protein
MTRAALVGGRSRACALTIGAIVIVCVLAGCRVVQLRYGLAMAQRLGHPVEIDLG